MGGGLRKAHSRIAFMMTVFQLASIIAIFRGGHACANGFIFHINHDIRSAATRVRHASWCCLCRSNIHPHSFALPCDLILPYLLHRFPRFDNWAPAKTLKRSLKKFSLPGNSKGYEIFLFEIRAFTDALGIFPCGRVELLNAGIMHKGADFINRCSPTLPALESSPMPAPPFANGFGYP